MLTSILMYTCHSYRSLLSNYIICISLCICVLEQCKITQKRLAANRKFSIFINQKKPFPSHISSQRSIETVYNYIITFIPYSATWWYFIMHLFVRTRASHRSKTRRNISLFRCIRAAVISFIKLPDGRQYTRSTICPLRSFVIWYLPDYARTCNSIRLPDYLPACPPCPRLLVCHLLVFPPAYLRVQSAVLVMPDEPSFHRQIFLWHSQSISVSFH